VPRPLKVGGQTIPWFHDPRYAPVRQEILEYFAPRISHLTDFIRSPKIVFLCGASDASSNPSPKQSCFRKILPRILSRKKSAHRSNRALLEEYFETRKQDVLTFRAEAAWSVIEPEFGNRSVLEHEEKLARTSDAIVIIVESFGTAAELGAFAIAPELRKKLLVILDRGFHGERSFINLGPVRWAESDSQYKPIYANLNNILEIAPQIDGRLKKKTPKQLHSHSWKQSATLSPKELLIALSKLIFVLGPVPREHLVFYLRKIFCHDDDAETAYSLSLASALGLIRNAKPMGFSSPFFYCPNFSISLIRDSMSQKRYRALSKFRARILDPLWKIDVYRNIDDQVRRMHADTND
jgi:hypothetical protein